MVDVQAIHFRIVLLKESFTLFSSSLTYGKRGIFGINSSISVNGNSTLLLKS